MQVSDQKQTVILAKLWSRLNFVEINFQFSSLEVFDKMNESYQSLSTPSDFVLCNLCNKSFHHKHYVICCSVCNKKFHAKQCLNMNKEQYNLMKNGYKCMVCEKSEHLEASNKSLLHDMFIIIQEMRLEMKSLKNEFFLMKKENQDLKQTLLNGSIYPIQESQCDKISDKIFYLKSFRNVSISSCNDVLRHIPSEILRENVKRVTSSNSIKNKVLHSKQIVGENDTDRDLSTAKRIKWLYIGRVDPKHTETDIKSYVRSKINTDVILCTEIKSNEHTKSFKLGIDHDFSKDLLTPTFWPRNILIRDYFFGIRGLNPPYQ